MKKSAALVLASRLALGVAGVASVAWTAHAGQVAPRAAVAAPAERAGWWMRANPTNEATHVYWRFGAAPNRLGAPITWQRGASPEAIDAPQDVRSLGQVHLAVLGMPPAAQVSFCVFYGDKGVALVEFTKELVLDVAQDRVAPQCIP